MNADMIPEAFPKVSCKPVAVVLLPYRGVLFGNYYIRMLDGCLLLWEIIMRFKLTQAIGRPTTTYKPPATRKHPK